MSTPSGTAAALKAVATGQQTPQQARNPLDVFYRQLDDREAEFAKLLGGVAQAQAFLRVVKNAVISNPQLLDCDRLSLMLSAQRAAQDGLLTDGREAVLNVYNTKVKQGNQWVWIKKVQYLPMVAGLIKLLYASGDVTYIDAAVWYERDVFRFTRGDAVTLVHEPYLGDEDPGKIMGAYVVVKLKNGEVKREVMPRRDIEKVRAASKAVDQDGNPTGPWKDWYDQQAIKSVIKRVYKQLPHTDKLDTAVAHDNAELHPQVAGAGGSIGDVAERSQGTTAAPERQQPAALTEDPSPTLGQMGDLGREQQPVGREEDEANTLRVRSGAEAVETGGPLNPTDDALFEGPTAEALIQRIAECADESVAELVLDEARALPEAADRDRVRAAFDEKWPPRPKKGGK